MMLPSNSESSFNFVVSLYHVDLMLLYLNGPVPDVAFCAFLIQFCLTSHIKSRMKVLREQLQMDII